MLGGAAGLLIRERLMIAHEPSAMNQTEACREAWFSADAPISDITGEN